MCKPCLIHICAYHGAYHCAKANIFLCDAESGPILIETRSLLLVALPRCWRRDNIGFAWYGGTLVKDLMICAKLSCEFDVHLQWYHNNLFCVVQYIVFLAHFPVILHGITMHLSASLCRGPS